MRPIDGRSMSPPLRNSSSANPAGEQPWYHEGLRFTCSQCGDCCTGAPGYIWVTRDEIEAIAAYLSLEVPEFEARYVRTVGNRKTLIDLPAANWDCVFLNSQTRGCNIYPVRPRQCRTWPFWESNVKTPEAWRATCQVCPGSGKGELVPLEAIQARLAVIKM